MSACKLNLLVTDTALGVRLWAGYAQRGVSSGQTIACGIDWKIMLVGHHAHSAGAAMAGLVEIPPDGFRIDLSFTVT